MGLINKLHKPQDMPGVDINQAGVWQNIIDATARDDCRGPLCFPAIPTTSTAQLHLHTLSHLVINYHTCLRLKVRAIDLIALFQ